MYSGQTTSVYNPEVDPFARPSASYSREQLDQRPQSQYSLAQPQPQQAQQPYHSRPSRSQSRPSAAPHPDQQYQYEYDGPMNGDLEPPSPPDGDDFYTGSQSNFNEPPMFYPSTHSVATQSIRDVTPPPGPLLDHSHLKPGNQASLLRYDDKRANMPKVT